MCWRIVRIDGNGNIKIILQNDNSSGGTLTDCSDQTLGSPYLKENGIVQFKYNDLDSDNTYLGLKYNVANQSTYELTHAMNNNSILLTKLETWYNSHLSGYENALADIVWCNDLSCNEGNCTGNVTSKYQAYNRLNNDGPSFKCQDRATGNIGLYSLSTNVNGKKIGTITADEAKYAGSVISSASGTVKSYLSKAAYSTTWTLTPYEFEDSHAYMVAIAASAKLSRIKTNSTANIRPMVALKVDTKVHGNGTIMNPYVVE